MSKKSVRLIGGRFVARLSRRRAKIKIITGCRSILTRFWCESVILNNFSRVCHYRWFGIGISLYLAKNYKFDWWTLMVLVPFSIYEITLDYFTIALITSQYVSFKKFWGRQLNWIYDFLEFCAVHFLYSILLKLTRRIGTETHLNFQLFNGSRSVVAHNSWAYEAISIIAIIKDDLMNDEFDKIDTEARYNRNQYITSIGERWRDWNTERENLFAQLDESKELWKISIYLG